MERRPAGWTVARTSSSTSATKGDYFPARLYLEAPFWTNYLGKERDSLA